MDDDELGARTSDIARALIEFTPAEFTSINCTVEQVERQCTGRLAYRIGCDDYPDDVSDFPSVELHEAAYELIRAIGAEQLQITMKQEDDNWSCSLQSMRRADDGDAERERDVRDEQIWQETYEARQQFFYDHVGSVPPEIQKLMTVHWPGGGIFDIEESKITNTRIFSSFGLSNPDMPSSVRIDEFKRVEEGDSVKFNSTLKSNIPRFVHPELAGYGYELMLLSGDEDDRFIVPVIWFIESEINHDLDLLGRVLQADGVTIQDVNVGSGQGLADFVVYPAIDVMPSTCVLPNGTMHLLVATYITRAEMDFGRSEGRDALMKKLMDSGVGQVSKFGRDSII